MTKQQKHSLSEIGIMQLELEALNIEEDLKKTRKNKMFFQKMPK